MLAAILRDFQTCREMEVSTLIAPSRRAALSSLAADCRHLAPPGNEEAFFRRLARTADWSLVIAPECGGCLAHCCRWALEEGGRLLGPSPAAVDLTADKLALSHHLQTQGIPSPPCFAPAQRPAGGFPLVCKPRDGAGSQATFLVHDEQQLAAALATAREEGWQGELIVQPFVAGLPVSVSFLAGPVQRIALPAVRQVLSTQGRFHYRGGSLPLAA
jgi:predicted ATP-grasp superfamily ATP-dependent carboligase